MNLYAWMGTLTNLKVSVHTNPTHEYHPAQMPQISVVTYFWAWPDMGIWSVGKFNQ